MQPIMRLLDFVLVQVLGVLATPEYFDSTIKRSTIFEEAPKMEKKGNKGPFDLMTIPEVLKTIKRPKFMDLKVCLEKPRIHLKARGDSDEYLVIDLGMIEINSVRNLRPERIKNEEKSVKCKVNDEPELKEILCESYCIWMRDMGLKLVKNGKDYDMSMPFHFNFSFERPMFMDEYKHCYWDLEIDNTMLMRSKILPLVLALHQNDYLLIMRTLFFNITYDDLLDRFMIHDFEMNMSAPSETGKIF